LLVLNSEKSREYFDLWLVLIVAIILSLFSLSIHFTDRLFEFLQIYTTMPVIEFILNVAFLSISGMLLVLYRRWKKVKKRAVELNNIIQSISPDVLLVVDSRRNILLCNGQVERIFKVEQDALIGQKTDKLYFDRRANADQKGEIYEILEEKGFHVGLAKGIRSDGKIFPLEIITGNLSDRDGAVLLLRDITERIAAQQALLMSEKRFRDLFESSPDAIIALDSVNNIMDVNHATCTMFANEHDKIVGKNISDLFPESYRVTGQSNLSMLQKGIIQYLEGSFLDSSNNIVPVEITTNKLNFSGIESSILHIRNISIRLANEKALEKEKEFVTAILNNSYDGLAVFNSSGYIVLLSPGMTRIFGFPHDEIPTISLWIKTCFLSERDRESLKEIQKKQPDFEKVNSQTYLIGHKDNSIKWCKLHFSRMDDNNIVVNGQDITEIVLKENQIKESEMKYRQVVERANDGIVIIQDDKIRYHNSKFAELVGYNSDTDDSNSNPIIGQNFIDFISDDYKNNYISSTQRKDETKILGLLESELKHATGRFVQVELNTGTMALDENIADLIFIKDISDLKIWEENINKRYNFEKLIASLSTKFLHHEPEENNRVFDEALSEIGHFYNVDRTYLVLINEKHNTIDMTHEWANIGIEKHDKKDLLKPSIYENLLEKLAESTVVNIADVNKIPDVYKGVF